VTQTVNASNTTTALTASTAAPVFGQPVTFTATVSAVAPGIGTPTGTVTFMDGASTLGTGTLASGVATLTTTATNNLGLGGHSIPAVSGAPTNSNPSPPSAGTVTVSQASTSTTLASSANPSVLGQPVTFTAVVSPVAPSSLVAPSGS